MVDGRDEEVDGCWSTTCNCASTASLRRPELSQRSGLEGVFGNFCVGYVDSIGSVRGIWGGLRLEHACAWA